MDLFVLLFNDFETLDAFGPVAVLGKPKIIESISFISLSGGTILSSQRVPVVTASVDAAGFGKEYVLLIPGGMGTRREVTNEAMLETLQRLAGGARFVLAVCTGSALLARAGLLDNRQATTNKMAYEWVVQQGSEVKWVRKARWVKDGNVYTSSGVSAGIDMALGFVADVYGSGAAEAIAGGIEYIWNRNREEDFFA